MRFIYDQDHTVIDSSHRQLTTADGSLDLSHWIENNTPEKIARDRLLPLAKHWRIQYARGAEIVVCTARVMGEHDYRFLADHGLKWHGMLSRTLGDRTPDAKLKLRALRNYAATKTYSWRRFCQFSVMMDDNQSVIQLLTANGLKCYNALEINARAA